MAGSVLLEEMTWPDVRDALGSGVKSVLIPVGSNEQHGKHLPVATDALLGQMLGTMVAERLGNTLVAPVIRVACSEHHMDFPGTITLRSETLVEVLGDYCRSLAHHGFRNIIMLPTHGGNFAPVREAYEMLKLEMRDTNLIAYTDLAGFIEIMFRSAAKFGVSREAAGSHSGEWETSAAMAIRPDLVHPERIEAGYMGDGLAITPRVFKEGMKAVTPNGIIGDPHGASASRGEVYLNDLADAVAAAIRERMS